MLVRPSTTQYGGCQVPPDKPSRSLIQLTRLNSVREDHGLSPPSSYGPGALTIASFWRFTAMLMKAEAKSFVFGTTLV